MDNWIRRALLVDPLRAKSVVMTVFGDAIMPRGGSVWLGSLITLLAPFGISDRLVRTSVFRLADEGWLEAERSGRRSQYRFTAQGETRFTRAHDRIYAPVQPPWDGRWTLVLFTAALSSSRRTALKKELLWEGFGHITPGVFVYPGEKGVALQDIVTRTHSAGEMFISTASDAAGATARPLSDLLALGWQLETVVKDYQRFIRCFTPVQALLSEADALEPAQAFTMRTLLIHAFRRVQLHDPQLPAACLSAGWPGGTAYALCRDIYQRCSQQAEHYVTETLAVEQSAVPALSAESVGRFGLSA